MKYLDLFNEEIDILQPKVIITFGNQVSSIILNKNINVSKYRKKFELLDINGKKTMVFPVYYPVGQGLRNIDVAKEDIDWIIKNYLQYLTSYIHYTNYTFIKAINNININ